MLTSETGSIDLDLSDVTNAELVAYIGVADALAAQAPQEGRRFLHVLARAFIAELHRREGGEAPGVVSVEISPEMAAFAARLQAGLGAAMTLRERIAEARRQAQAGLAAAQGLQSDGF